MRDPTGHIVHYNPGEPEETDEPGESNFTPGPWQDEITAEGDLVVVRGDGSRIYLGDMETTGSDDHADAHLIAAAPDMYAALVAIMERVPLKDFPNQEHAPACLVCQEIASRALDKAERNLA